MELLVYAIVVAIAAMEDYGITLWLYGLEMSPLGAKSLACIIVLACNFIGRRYLAFPFKFYYTN